MRPFIIPNLFFLLFTLNTSGQTDQAAIKILDKFSSTALSAPSVSMKFKLTTTDHAENTERDIPGSVILSKDKYFLETSDNTIWFNGSTFWSYLPDANEVTITKADKKDNSFTNRPSEIFSMYKNGFKSKLIEEKPESYVIDLYPEDIKSDLHRVRLLIGKARMNLIGLEYKKKDGIIITLEVLEYNLKIKPDNDMFVFHPEKFEGVEVIDMR